MGNLNFLSIVFHELSKEKVLKEEELGRLLTNNTMESGKKLKKVLKALRDYKEVIGDMETWDNYISQNITIPNNKDLNEVNNNPEEGNNNKEKE